MDAQLDLKNYSIWYDDTTYRFWFETLFFYVIIIVLVGLAVGCLIFYKKSRVKPYWQVELDNLDALETKLASGISDKEFYSAITDIAKRYVKFKSNLDLGAKTENEIVSNLEDADKLKIIFLNAAQAKYSQGDDLEQNKREVISTFREFILKNI